MSLQKAFIFLKRDFLENISYKLSFIFNFGGIVFSCLTFFFIAKLFGTRASPYLSRYGGEYFPFVLIGIAFFGYLTTAMGSFTGSIAREQTTGTLEFILMSPTKLSTVLIGGYLWNFLFTSFRIFIYLFLGAVFFGVNLGRINLLSSLLVLSLTIISFSSIGIISASFIIVLKRGNPVNWLFGGFSGFLGGVYFPITILPIWVQKISKALPITYSLRAMRLAVLQGSSLSVLASDIIALFAFCIILLPVSILMFKLAVGKAKRDGSLVHY